jgi:SAM-dependent methyltransferase
MESVTHNLLGKILRGGADEHPAPPAPPRAAERSKRRSSGLAEFSRAIAGREDLCALDLGRTSASNITRLIAMGHKVYTEDVLVAAQDRSLLVPGEDGKPVLNVARFLKENLIYRGPIFDAVLAWDVADYLPEALVKPVVERLCAGMKPGGVLLAFFHTRDAGPEAPHYRYHLAGNDMLELEPSRGCALPGPRGQAMPAFRLQRVFQNRHIENLFRDFASIKFFLARDNVREVLVVR